MPDRQKLIEDAKKKLLDAAIEEIKNNLIKSIEEQILQPIMAIVQATVEAAHSIPNPKPTLAQIKKFVKDKKDGIKPEIDIPIDIPNLPTKEDFIIPMMKDKQMQLIICYQVLVV